jgi:glucose-1-phosphate cytidylyltransferase
VGKNPKVKFGKSLRVGYNLLFVSIRIFVKVVILAGGYGTRISEETYLRPKPMVEIGSKPILWHIMKLFSVYGIYDFIICLGYKGYLIKEYFANYYLHTSDVTFDMVQGSTIIHQNNAEPWRITLVETGDETMTGGRLKRVAAYLNKEDFCFTYGDGLGNINITDLISYHKQQKTLATLTAVQTLGRFGALTIEQNKVLAFREKPVGDGAWISGGFFVLSPSVLNYIRDDSTLWEKEPLEILAQEGQLSAYFHRDFWQPMDTLRDKNILESLWASGKAPWKIWEEKSRCLAESPAHSF